jgi:hypothetical protein
MERWHTYTKIVARWYSLVVFTLALIPFASFCTAQAAPGMPNFVPYDCHEVDCVNLSNLNIVLNLPFFAKSGAFSLTYSMVGTSGMWYNTTGTNGSGGSPSWQPNFQYGPGMLWGSVNGGELGWGNFFSGSQPPVAIYTSSNLGELCPDGSTHTNWYGFWEVIDANYTIHPLPITDATDTANCYGSGFTDAANDGSGYVVTATSGAVTGLYDSAGKTLTETSLTDSNANTISVSNSGTGSGQTLSYTDTLGLTAITIAIGTTDGPSWTDINSGTQTVTPAYTRNTILTNFGCSGKNEFSNNATYAFLTSLAYPDGTSLGITYEQTPSYGSGYYTGRLAGLTLREGGTVSYSYSGGNNGMNCTYQIPPTLKRITTDGTTVYVSSPTTSGSTTTVTDTGGNNTVSLLSQLAGDPASDC